MPARALMILGTASHVGKSLLTAALGRILADEGYRVAPFKAQNMSLNSAATPDGREIGRAQALQAEACRVAARAEMNPVLIKPATDTCAQVVVLGRVWGQVSATDYHQRRVEELFPLVVNAYRTLAAEYEIVLLEGAGSPAEINLKAGDIVNMRMAQAAGAACWLVGDIDRGGVFASLLGTVELLEPEERALLRGFILNKFRGDRALLEPGVEMMSRRIGLPCAGVVPFLPDLGLDEEDSVSLEERPPAGRVWKISGEGPNRRLRIAVLAFPHLANFTDFDALAAEPSVALAFVDNAEDVAQADLLILPGSKQTLDDLAWLRMAPRSRGLESAIQAFRGGAGLIGICGGMQMLGLSIEDPHGAESNGFPRGMQGLGILPIRTVLRAEKVTRPVRGRVLRWARSPAIEGYEIHMGETVYEEGACPFAEIQRAGESAACADGCAAAERPAFGTYIHGLFHNDEFRHSFLAAARAACALGPLQQKRFFAAEREARIDRLADHVRRALDMRLIHTSLGDFR
ncbi:MAG TPA: cobyric acid synthase [Bryobacteraceae bacterium]|nr:cobyric acid synthase [Bryobacteraceae bacterium]